MLKTLSLSAILGISNILGVSTAPPTKTAVPAEELTQTATTTQPLKYIDSINILELVSKSGLTEVTVRVDGQEYVGANYVTEGKHMVSITGKTTKGETKVKQYPVEVVRPLRANYSGYIYPVKLGDELEIMKSSVYSYGRGQEIEVSVKDKAYRETEKTVYVDVENKEGDYTVELDVVGAKLPPVTVHYTVHTVRPTVEVLRMAYNGIEEPYQSPGRTGGVPPGVTPTKTSSKLNTMEHKYIGNGDTLSIDLSVGDEDNVDEVTVQLELSPTSTIEKKIALSNETKEVTLNLTNKDVPSGVYPTPRINIKDKYGNENYEGDLPSITVITGDSSEYKELLALYKEDKISFNNEFTVGDATRVLNYYHTLQEVHAGDKYSANYLEIIKQGLIEGKMLNKAEELEKESYRNVLLQATGYVDISVYNKLGIRGVVDGIDYGYMELLRGKTVQDSEMTLTKMNKIIGASPIIKLMDIGVVVTEEQLTKVKELSKELQSSSVTDYINQLLEKYTSNYKISGVDIPKSYIDYSISEFKEYLSTEQKKSVGMNGGSGIMSLNDEDIEIYQVALDRKKEILSAGEVLGVDINGNRYKLEEISQMLKDVLDYRDQYKIKKGNGLLNVEYKYLDEIRNYTQYTVDDSQGSIISRAVVDSKIRDVKEIKLSKADYEDIDKMRTSESNIDLYNKYINEYFKSTPVNLINTLKYMDLMNNYSAILSAKDTKGVHLLDKEYINLPESEFKETLRAEVVKPILDRINKTKEMTAKDYTYLGLKNYDENYNDIYTKYIKGYLTSIGREVTVQDIETYLKVVNTNIGVQQSIERLVEEVPELLEYENLVLTSTNAEGTLPQSSEAVKTLIKEIYTNYSTEHSKDQEVAVKKVKYAKYLSNAEMCRNFDAYVDSIKVDKESTSKPEKKEGGVKGDGNT